MTLLVTLAAWSLFAFGLLLIVVQMVAYEGGYWLGRRHAREKEVQSEGLGVMVGGILGLLAFVLALTLAFANERFYERRNATLAEANAVGTAWLRAKAIGQPRGDEIARLLEQYTRLRIDYIEVPRGQPELQEINKQTGVLQSEIWGHVAALVRAQPTPVVAALMASLNDVFDMTTASRFSFALRLPGEIFWLLIGLTLLGILVVGYQQGLRGQRLRVFAALLSVVWTVLIVDIVDLAAARFGSFRTSVAAYYWTLDGFEGGVTIPPEPAK
jgi:hypothetical protein